MKIFKEFWSCLDFVDRFFERPDVDEAVICRCGAVKNVGEVCPICGQ